MLLFDLCQKSNKLGALTAPPSNQGRIILDFQAFQNNNNCFVMLVGFERHTCSRLTQVIFTSVHIRSASAFHSLSKQTPCEAITGLPAFRHAFCQVRFARKRRELQLPPPPSIWKRLDCAIFGTPNVGKSVLLNALVKQKLAATNRKRHTTRGEILGVFNHRQTQLVFFDTPGYISKRDAMKQEYKTLRETSTTSVEKADVVLLVVDAARVLSPKQQYIFSEMVKIGLHHSKKELILILNKVDLVEPKSKLLETTRQLVSIINGVKLGPEKAHLAELDTTTFMISAMNNDGILDLKNYLLQIADPKPWMLAKGKKGQASPITTLSDEERVEEIVLEKLLDHTHEEIPYVAKVECTAIGLEDNNPKKMRFDVDIILENNRQVKMVVGHQARTLVKIRQAAAEDLEKIFPGKTVYVYLWIKASKKSSSMAAMNSGDDSLQ
jgi:GTP-binding protein Era